MLFDGLGTFEHSQYWPVWLNTALHKESSFMLGFTASELRRSGTMTSHQRRTRGELESRVGRPKRDEIFRQTRDLLRTTATYLDRDTVAFGSDDHPVYPGALREAGLGDRPHQVTPGRLLRDERNPLFEINLADMLLRHRGSHLKRETIAFSKRRQAILEKSAIFMVDRNFMRSRRAKRPKDPTPAMLAGIAQRPLTEEDFFARRIFADEAKLPEVWEAQVRRDARTRVLRGHRVHQAVYSY